MSQLNPKATSFVPKSKKIEMILENFQKLNKPLCSDTVQSSNKPFEFDIMVPSFRPKQSSYPLDESIINELKLWDSLKMPNTKDIFLENIIMLIKQNYINGKACALPSEYVQNKIKIKYPNEYFEVVTKLYNNSWSRFISSQSDTLEVVHRQIDKCGQFLIKIKGEDVTESIKQMNNYENILVESIIFSMYNAVWHSDKLGKIIGANGDISLVRYMEWYDNNTDDFVKSGIIKQPFKMPELPKIRKLLSIVKKYPNRISIVKDHEIRFIDAITWKPEKQKENCSIPEYETDSSDSDSESDKNTKDVFHVKHIDFDRQKMHNDLVKITREIILRVNPNHGSVPSERIQNKLKSENTELYYEVVGRDYNNQWNRFLRNNSDVFHLFYVKKDLNCIWRVRLMEHENWMEVDKIEETNKDNIEYKQRQLIIGYLKTRITDKIDNILNYLEQILHYRPPRGDFCRFIKRNSDVFFIRGKNSNQLLEYTITLRS